MQRSCCCVISSKCKCVHQYQWKHSISNSGYSQAAASQHTGKRKLVCRPSFATYCRVRAGNFGYAPEENLQSAHLPAKRTVWRKEFWRHSLLITFGIFTYILNYLLNPRSRVFVKLTISQPVKKFHAFYGTRRFITAFTSVRHLFLSWANSIQSLPPHLTSWRSILILSSH